MDRVDQQLVSIFDKKDSAQELMQSMRDIASLSGVLSDLGTENSFQSPIEILRFLRIIQLLNEEALGLSEPIENAEMVYYRYRNRYSDNEPPTRKRVEQVITILVNNNWVSKQAHQLKMRDRGKRMMDALIRLANDSLAYYLNDDIGRSLFQARRDAEISEAYDDKGISGGNKIASMIRNVENAIQLLQERELEMLADRNALPQLEAIHYLMLELDVKMQERLNKFATLEDSLIMGNLIQKGTSVLAKGTRLSLGMITKYMKFTAMQQGPSSSVISPEKVRTFIISMYDPPLDSDIPNVHQLFSFMEHNKYTDEAVDGFWMPVKFASPLSPLAIDEAVYHLETYEPIVGKSFEGEVETDYAEDEVEMEDIASVMGDADWLITTSMIDTVAIENYLVVHEETELEELVVEAASSKWGDAITGLTAIAALEGNKKIHLKRDVVQKKYDKEWKWMNDDDGRYKVRATED